MGGVLAFWGKLDRHGDATDPFPQHFGQAFLSEEYEPPSSGSCNSRPEAPDMVPKMVPVQTLSFPQTSKDLSTLSSDV
jgi:hypothetical protein